VGLWAPLAFKVGQEGHKLNERRWSGSSVPAVEFRTPRKMRNWLNLQITFPALTVFLIGVLVGLRRGGEIMPTYHSLFDNVTDFFDSL